MAKYEYSLVDLKGKTSWVVEDFESILELESDLNRRRIDYLQIRQAPWYSVITHLSVASEDSKTPQRIKTRELIEFCIHLSVLVEAGVSLTQSIQDFIPEVKNPYFKYVIKDLYIRVTNGSSLSDSLADYPKVFSDEFTYLIKAGEKSGTLPNALNELKKYLEWREKIKSEMSQATVYPSIVAVVVGIFILFLFSSIVPGIAKILVDLKVELPWMTKVVMAISDFIVSYGLYTFAAIVITVMTTMYFYKHNATFHYQVDGIKLKIPIFGPLTSIVLQARFVHNFTIIHKAGISILENLDLCYRFVPNRIYQSAIIHVKDDIRDGRSLTDSMRDTGVFSSLIMRMIAVGESSGKLEYSLDQATKFYDEEIPRRLKKVLSLLEPALILTLIGIVGFVALSIFLPILSITGGIK